MARSGAEGAGDGAGGEAGAGRGAGGSGRGTGGAGEGESTGGGEVQRRLRQSAIWLVRPGRYSTRIGKSDRRCCQRARRGLLAVLRNARLLWSVSTSTVEWIMGRALVKQKRMAKHSSSIVL